MPYTCDLCGKNFRYKVTQRTHKCIAKSQENSPQQFNDAGIFRFKIKDDFQYICKSDSKLFK